MLIADGLFQLPLNTFDSPKRDLPANSFLCEEAIEARPTVARTLATSVCSHRFRRCYEFCLVSGFRTRILRSVATTKHPAHSATFSF